MTKKNIDKTAIKIMFGLILLGLIGKSFIFLIVGAAILTFHREFA